MLSWPAALKDPYIFEAAAGIAPIFPHSLLSWIPSASRRPRPLHTLIAQIYDSCFYLFEIMMPGILK